MSEVLAPAALSAEAVEHWMAYSRTAVGITGDITLSTSEITFADGQRLQLSPVGTATGVILAPVISDDVADVYRINEPRDLQLLSGNVLCGASRLPTYMTALKVGDRGQSGTLYISFLTGDATPSQGMDERRFCASLTFKR